MLIGYARVSTDDQTLDPQRDALLAAGCAQVFEDEGISGAARHRPGLDRALLALASGDVLIVWKLDRLGRSLSHLIEIAATLGTRDIGFRSARHFGYDRSVSAPNANASSSISA